MTRPQVAYGCCVSSWTKLDAYVRPHVGDSPLLTEWGATSISKAYNGFLDLYRGKDLDAVVLLHDDLEITDPLAIAKFLGAMDEGVAIAGVCGGSARNGLAWWSADPVGHQLIDEGLIDFGLREGEVESLEGSIMVFSPWAIEYLRFDESFDGFHGYDHIGLVARRQDRRVVVVDVDTHHHTVTGFKSPESEMAWLEADHRFRELYVNGAAT